MTTRNRYKEFLIWLITPQNGGEQERFANCVDEHIEVMANINNYTEEELKELINQYLSIYELEITQ